MGLILDTSVLIEAERGNFDVDGFVAGREEEAFGLSVVSVAELLHGVHRAESAVRRVRRSVYVEQVIELFPIFPFDIAAARIYASLWAQLQMEGTPLGAHDLMIGSTALSLGFSVCTFNRRDFEKIQGLEVEIPSAP